MRHGTNISRWSDVGNTVYSVSTRREANPSPSRLGVPWFIRTDHDDEERLRQLIIAGDYDESEYRIFRPDGMQ